MARNPRRLRQLDDLLEPQRAQRGPRIVPRRGVGVFPARNNLAENNAFARRIRDLGPAEQISNLRYVDNYATPAKYDDWRRRAPNTQRLPATLDHGHYIAYEDLNDNGRFDDEDYIR
jgi:hypothetical protein